MEWARPGQRRDLTERAKVLLLPEGRQGASAVPPQAGREAEDVRAVCPHHEGEAGWTTEKSPKGLEVLDTEHGSRNVLAQYLHNILSCIFL